MFVLEPHDEHVLSHPRETIIDPGGVILFAANERGEVIGTGALMPTVERAVELTKMGVVEKARGTGAGRLLLGALLERAKALRFGSNYARCDVAMSFPPPRLAARS